MFSHDHSHLNNSITLAVRDFLPSLQNSRAFRNFRANRAIEFRHRIGAHMTEHFVTLVVNYARSNFRPSLAEFEPIITNTLQEYMGSDMVYYSDGEDDDF
tara:strand:+ start:220 stop:519 length:300 start_codon:yes stop_codon:yes gene_type:complete